jgi:hypothetical protein
MSLPKDSPSESPMSLADNLLLKERNRSLIVHPEAIHVLFELSKYADNEGTQLLIFIYLFSILLHLYRIGGLCISFYRDVYCLGLKTAALINVTERLLIHDENIEIIWNGGSWLDWCVDKLFLS